MKKAQITINGKSFPCRLTMGAMLRFKQEYGKEATEIEDGNVSEMCALLWLSVKSSCSADGAEFDLSLIDFADRLSKDDLTKWAADLSDEAITDEEDDEKKAVKYL